MWPGNCHLHPLNGFYCSGSFRGSLRLCVSDFASCLADSLLESCSYVLHLHYLKPVRRFPLCETTVYKLCQHEMSLKFLKCFVSTQSHISSRILEFEVNLQPKVTGG